ncbi:hypothetical protein CTI12_AA575810 [Artemisia annua]|uniref:Transmembrane protein n=1 Tax=Artemisia annua TaxID=35608 RepID=A0A2U1KQ50_ARTAN|nr:hypothetical protein CTI12_AA575810 [Artemisia annua]
MASITITKIDQMSENIFLKCRGTIQIFTTNLLSLLLPLSFLLLARLSTADYLMSLNDYPAEVELEEPSMVFFSLLLNAIPLSPLHILVSLLCVASLVHNLNHSRITFPSFLDSLETGKPRLYMAWIVLCTLQVCVGLGIEGSIGAGIDGSGFGHERNFICRIVFFLGLHATTTYWWRTIVKPVVDDTIFGFEVEERWIERVVMGASLGGLWWWRLRDEVEALVVVVEMKREMEVGVGVVDLMGWWLYYLVVTIGMVKVLKCLIWFGVVLLYRKVEQVRDDNDDDSLGVQEKEFYTDLSTPSVCFSSSGCGLATAPRRPTWSSLELAMVPPNPRRPRCWLLPRADDEVYILTMCTKSGAKILQVSTLFSNGFSELDGVRHRSPSPMASAGLNG